MTVKLYENDSYIKQFEAVVLSCDKNGDTYDVVLDKTAFFPEGGGQAADIGTLCDANVLDVQIIGEKIIHKTDKALTVGQSVCGEIDWDLRFARMQNHSGEHIVSGIINSLFGYNNVGFHMSEKTMTLDVDGVLTAEDIVEIEKQANRAVYSNSDIYALYPSAKELDNIQYRSKIDFKEGVRLIKIDNYDCCACCAPHVAKTGEIGIIKLLDFYPNKQGTRVELVCGVNALEDYCFLHNTNKSLMHLLSAARDKTIEKAQKNYDEMMSLRSENKSLSERLVMAQLETVNINNSICAFSENSNYDELRYCANIFSENDIDYCAVFSKTEDDNYIYVISSKNNDVRAVVNALNSAFQGRGGGKPNYAQGKITSAKQAITELLKGII
ncbi:MAG: hypothetical protein IJF54_07215 [Clostridia bacterium]|nr:hypothetical protein [Clostridia bacterium]